MEKVLVFLVTYSAGSAFGVAVYFALRALEKRSPLAVAVGGGIIAVLLFLHILALSVMTFLVFPAFSWLLLSVGRRAHLASGGASRTKGDAMLCLFAATVLSLWLGFGALSIATRSGFVPLTLSGKLQSGDGAHIMGILLGLLLTPCATPILLWLRQKFQHQPGVTR